MHDDAPRRQAYRLRHQTDILSRGEYRLMGCDSSLSNGKWADLLEYGCIPRWPDGAADPDVVN
jgi:hypothetical protein